MGKPDSHLTEIQTMTEISQARLWKSLDSISDRLGTIEIQLSEVVRLEERVNQHDSALSRYGNRLDSHDNRIRESELWQANQGDKSSVERLVTNVQQEVHDLRSKIDGLETTKDISKGQKDVGKEILKWVSVILTGIILMIIKG